MTPASKINQSSLSEADLRGDTESPTVLAGYWFQSQTMSRAIMVEVRLTNGQLTARAGHANSLLSWQEIRLFGPPHCQLVSLKKHLDRVLFPILA